MQFLDNAVVLATVNAFLSAWDTSERDPFNTAIARRYEGIRDYLVCHYRAAQRHDTEYWRAATTNNALSDSLKGVITAWFTADDLEQEVLRQDIASYYPPMSWHCMLAGYGNFAQDAMQQRLRSLRLLSAWSAARALSRLRNPVLGHSERSPIVKLAAGAVRP